MATLYIVATPIGNLNDITLRALEVLKSVDYILCEDTRVTQKLLNNYGIEKQLISYHQHTKLTKIDFILDLLRQDKNLALVSDAGTPGISDPGNELIEKVSQELPAVKIIPIPGPSAVTAIASVSGFAMDKFSFLGFPPHKKRRTQFFKKIIESEIPAIFYESPYRLLKSLKELGHAAENTKSSLKIAVGKELTKKFEKIYRGAIGKVIAEIEADKPKGEYVVVVAKEKPRSFW